MNSFYLKVISADKVFYEGRVRSLIVPAIDGAKEILSHHENFLIALDDGELKIQELEDSPWHVAVVGKGFVQIANNRVTVLVETAEKPEDIDKKRALEAEERAKEQLRQKESIREYYHSKASLARAMERLKAASKYRKF